MDKRTLGTNGPEVSAIGLGCMSMSGGYSDRPDRQEMISLIRAAVDRGVSFFDTAEIYGTYANEELVGEALAPYKGQVVIATKFGWDIDPVERKSRGRVTSRPAVIKQVVDGSLHRLGVEAIDLYYQHRVDPEVPIEDVEALWEDTRYIATAIQPSSSSIALSISCRRSQHARRISTLPVLIGPQWLAFMVRLGGPGSCANAEIGTKIA